MEEQYQRLGDALPTAPKTWSKTMASVYWEFNVERWRTAFWDFVDINAGYDRLDSLFYEFMPGDTSWYEAILYFTCFKKKFYV